VDRGGGYVAYKLIVFLLILIPIAVTDILIIIATILEPSVKKTIKMALINIPIACLIVMAGFTIDAIAASAYTLARMAIPDLWPCYIMVYLIALGAVSRLVFMALFSVTVYVIVRVGKKVTPFIFAIVVTSLWVFLVLFNCVAFIPGVIKVEWTFLMVVLYKTFQLAYSLYFSFLCAHVPDVCRHHCQPTIHACSSNVFKLIMY